MLILDFILLIMIGICITYCWMLNRRIQDLQNSRVEFARMIKELNVSIVKAEASVKDLSEVAKITSTELKTSVDEAKTNCQELKILTDLADNISEELSNQIRSIKQEQREYFNTALKEKSNTEPSNRYQTILKKSGIEQTHNNEMNDRFTDEDLIDNEDYYDDKIFKHKNDLTNTVTNIITKKPEENNLNYYDTLRRISAKK